jgi:hypothetical protein
MIKEQITQQLKQEFAKGNLKPSQLKRSKSASDLPKSIQATEPRRRSLEGLTNPNSLKKQLEKAQDQISILELKLETSQRELSELNSLVEENKHLKEQAKIKQQQMEELRKTLAETNSKLIQTQKDLDASLIARHQGLKDFGSEYEKRKLAQQELNSAVEESSEELVNQDQLLTKLRAENFKLKQTNSQLSRDLSLSSRLAEMRKVPYEPEFNQGLNYFKYAVYALLAVGFMLMLRRNNV